MKRRLLAVILGISMTAGMLAGCGKKAEKTQDGAGARDMTAGAADGKVDDLIRDWLGGDAEPSGEAEVDQWLQEAPQIAYESKSGAMMNSYDMAEAAPGMYYDVDCWPAPPYGEEYTAITENSFIKALEQPFSTFSADVDTASYSNLRRMIRSGYATSWIPKDSVRVEEMINYFSYRYNGPRSGEPFGVNPEITACPWNPGSYLLRIGLQTEAIDFSDAAPSNLVFLIDVSGSMYSQDKLPLLQKSFGLLTENLTEKDRVSIVTYAGSDQIVLTGARGNETQRILEALNGLEAGGCTNGSAGITTAYELAQEYFIVGGNNRVILATDGDLNVGLTSVGELEDLVSEKKQTGIFLSVLGFGTGNIKDNKMETLADKGNGNYAYIDSLVEAKKVLVEEMGATLVTVAKDVKLQMEWNTDIVSEYRLIGYENRALSKEDFTDDTKDAGEIGAGHSVTVIYEVKPVRSDLGLEAADSSIADLHIRYKEPDGESSKQLDYTIGSEYCTDRPSEDLRFAACVAAFGMVIRGSEYCGELTYQDILSMLGRINVAGDEYKAEFVELVKTLMDNDNEQILYDDDYGYFVD